MRLALAACEHLGLGDELGNGLRDGEDVVKCGSDVDRGGGPKGVRKGSGERDAYILIRACAQATTTGGR